MTTAPPTAPGLALAGDGLTISLTDGSVVRIRYSMRSLALLEAKFGSVQAIQTAMDATGAGAAFGPIIDLVGPGTIGAGGFEPHIREHLDAKGTRTISSVTYRRKSDGVELGELLSPALITEYVTAMATGITEGLGGGQGNDNAPTAGATETVLSPGLTSTTSPSAPSTSAP
ncbi:hypothetical protein [Actinacidiphila sp. ITFR-21]|uniref:hypothetical protein n=1 Tax=Actinacidiphila sp. ITFR-21 TaxID=3075199 RepID=UPI00288B5D12|nr:hypothetical protein [Streptomyces sp. ITFR-21]WNI15577.1 hypothetical protein RLT57_08575 [Streptomyces sp. ITFR-21]